MIQKRDGTQLRLGVKALEEGHEVKMFLLGPGVEIQKVESPDFDISGVLDKLIG